MKKIMMTRLSVCSLGVSCNEIIDTPMLLVVIEYLVCRAYFNFEVDFGVNSAIGMIVTK